MRDLGRPRPALVYFSAEELKEADEPLSGSFGIGVQFSIFKDTIMVVSPISGDTWNDGIRAGDRIVEVDGENTIGITNRDVMKLLKGPKGTVVQVGGEANGAVEV